MAYTDELIPISHIRQFLFCPRVFWFKSMMNLNPPEQSWVKQGKRWHDEQDTRHQRRMCHFLPEPTTKKTDVYVRSIALGLHGFVDELIVYEKRCVLVEYKVDKRKPILAHQLQLLAYGLAVEEYLQLKVEALLLLKGDARKQYEIKIDDSLKNKLQEVLAQMKAALNCHHVPFSSANEAKCEQCEYLRYCNDR